MILFIKVQICKRLLARFEDTQMTHHRENDELIAG